jgi:hypothetical protein
MKLSHQDFDFLQNELIKTPIMGEEELRYIKSAHDWMYYTTHNIKIEGNVLHTESCLFYNLNNNKLNNFLCEKFNEPLNNLYTMHRLVYGVGGKCERHMDRFTTHKTVSIILSEEFEGGDMYINDEKVEMNSKGDYICFNGGKDFHEVKEITYGKRDVLVIWFSKKQSKFNII